LQSVRPRVEPSGQVEHRVDAVRAIVRTISSSSTAVRTIMARPTTGPAAWTRGSAPRARPRAFGHSDPEQRVGPLRFHRAVQRYPPCGVGDVLNLTGCVAQVPAVDRGAGKLPKSSSHCITNHATRQGSL